MRKVMLATAALASIGIATLAAAQIATPTGRPTAPQRPISVATPQPAPANTAGGAGREAVMLQEMQKQIDALAARVKSAETSAVLARAQADGANARLIALKAQYDRHGHWFRMNSEEGGKSIVVLKETALPAEYCTKTGSNTFDCKPPAN